MNRFLLALGALFILTGLLWRLIKRMYLFHLPGVVVPALDSIYAR